VSQETYKFAVETTADLLNYIIKVSHKYYIKYDNYLYTVYMKIINIIIYIVYINSFFPVVLFIGQ